MKFILKYLKKFPKEILAVVLSTIVTCLSILGIPTMLAEMIDKAIVVNQISNAWPYIWGIVLFTVLGFISRSIRMYMASRVVNQMTMEIRNDVYSKMLNLSHHEFQEFGVPSLTNRITNDAFVILQFTEMLLKQGMMGPVMIVFSVFMIMKIAPNLGFRITPAVFMILAFVVIIALTTKPLSEKQQKYLDKLNRILRESITGLRVIRAFNREAFQNNRFMAVNHQYRKTSGNLFKIMAAAPSLFYLVVNVTMIAIIWMGAKMIAVGELQVGTLSAFIEYIFQALFSLVVFANIFMMYPRAAVSANRLGDVQKAPITVQNPKNPVKEVKERGTLEFKHVDFAYPDADEPVLRDISFKSRPGETVAFIGSTGSGKSTIVKLIPRFYDVTRGQILVDGVDVRDYDLRDLRKKIGFTPQSALLFKGKIADNLRYGKHDADTADMDHATEISQARDFLSKLEEGYDSELAEKGSNLSGGQKQRLSIARSIIEDREIYIFDDSFSALDYKTDAKVRAALKEETKGATTIIVAQRVGTIMHADQIVVLDRGRIDAIGTHEELLRNSDIYYKIASSQLSEEELKIEKE
ncbi:ABC transporter ATP-binding protein [Facklamia sp. DSM 111018]|uniref:ABC transporter ATP-binding protein n=1 Tax=Facklamia lactis TaxID=2749967 RepID=A0ABS0LNC7_9LACT|nr:ABC transporter ATP-binding protein [Facklamia lactis]MBG9979686.1 ABC transporter ATP-binding protein [Facklamia lactis]MBG9985634.1 ABC transporter ATP-binding protein [Facklamia lactis]